MNALQRAALRRAQDAILFAFSEDMRLDLLAETGIDDVNAALRVGRSPDNRLQVLLPPIETTSADKVVALLLTCVQAVLDSAERAS
jgi:hypothetical protein